MESISELRKKIRAIRSTHQITNAMKMIASARFHRAQNDAKNALSLPSALFDMIHRVHTVAPTASCTPFVARALADEDTNGEVGLIIVAGDKGLCGDFNSAVARQSRLFVEKSGRRISHLFAIGRKAFAFGQEIGARQYHEYSGTTDDGYEHANRIGQEVLKWWTEGSFSSLHGIYHSFESAQKNNLHVVRLLPFTPANTAKTEVLLEPDDAGDMLASLIPMWLKGKLFEFMKQSYAAELAARMLAMDNASKNALQMIDHTTLEMNKARQATITRELVEIIGANEAVR